MLNLDKNSVENVTSLSATSIAKSSKSNEQKNTFNQTNCGKNLRTESKLAFTKWAYGEFTLKDELRAQKTPYGRDSDLAGGQGLTGPK